MENLVSHEAMVKEIAQFKKIVATRSLNLV